MCCFAVRPHTVGILELPSMLFVEPTAHTSTHQSHHTQRTPQPVYVGRFYRVLFGRFLVSTLVKGCVLFEGGLTPTVSSGWFSQHHRVRLSFFCGELFSSEVFEHTITCFEDSLM